MRLNVVEAGPANGAAVVLLHGWAASSYTFRFLLPALASGGYRAIAIDFRGHGTSEKPRCRGCYRRQVLQADTLAVMDALGVASANFVGWSMGGAVGLHLALELPTRVRRLVLVNPAGLSPIRVMRIAALMSPRFLDQLPPFQIPRWLVELVLKWAWGAGPPLSSADVDRYAEPGRDSRFSAALLALLREFDWRPIRRSELSRLRLPTLVILGTMDRLVRGVAGVLATSGNVQIVTLRGAGHMAHEEQPEVADQAILRFLEDRSVK